MECFNCNEQATTKLSVEPDFGDIYTCGSQTCKDKARSDFEKFQSMKYHQGRRKDQVELAERTIAWALIGVILVSCAITLASIANKL
jgi:hypothetical protein